MFDVLAPGKLVLTLRSTPPFVAESAFALALTILLAAPLIVRVYLLLDKPLRALTKTASSRRSDRASRSLLIHYPAPTEVADSTSSSSLHPESARRINSTPTFLRRDGGVAKSSSRRGTRTDGKVGDRGSKIRRCPPLDPSSLADSRHRMVDVSGLDYKAYRHRLIEATLRSQYDDFQPPGDVVLNSLHLNSADSVIGVRLNDRYDHSLFDFVEEYYDVARSRKNVERPRPLDHFLPRGARRPRTSEKETETIPDDNGVDRENSRNHLPENVDGNLLKLSDMDDNGNPCVRAPSDDAIATSDREPKSRMPILRRSIPAQSRKRADKRTFERDAEDDCLRSTAPSARKESSWPENDRPTSAGSASKSSQAATSPETRETTGSPRPGTRARNRSRESKKKLDAHPPAVPPLSDKRRAERQAGGRSNLISVSSGEIASIRSDSSKRRDDQVSCRSRESSISPRSRASSRPPWMSGNGGTSFNRKYGGSIAEISGAPPGRVARPMSARGSGPLGQKLAVSSRGRSKESPTSRNPALLGRRAASFVASRGEELVETSTARQREENLAARSRGRRGKSKNVESVAVEDDKEGRTSKSGDSLSGEKMTSPDNAALSFLSSPAARKSVRPTRRLSPRATSFAPVPASETSATKEAELITSRSGAWGAPPGPGLGNNAPRLGSVVESARDRRESPSAKLNRGGRRRLRSAENPSKGASLSPQIELSAEVLNPADDTDKSAIPDGEGLTSRIDPREDPEAGRVGSDVKSDSADDVAERSGALKIIRDPRARPAGAHNLAGSRGGPPHPTRRDANSGTKSGLNGAKLNAGSNGAADEMRYDESAPAEASALAPPRECGNVAAEELHLPRHDSKIGLAMNSALRRYIKMLKQGDKDGVALASLSLSDAVAALSPLSPEEVQELQAVLDRIERNPELLCKLSCPSMESIA